MKKYVLLGSAAVAALGISASVAAQERVGDICYVVGGDEENSQQFLCYDGKPILVPASRNRDLKIEDYTGSATIIDSATLRDRQVRDVADVLRDVPGVAVSSVAGQTQIRLRGSEANHVLVLVDGIEVSDPFGGEFDLGTLQAEIGARVEVLRGPQSALYGSDAIGGVVAYESGYYDGFAGLVEAGTQGTVNASARFGVSKSNYNASLSATVVSTDGEPNARDGLRDIGRDSYTVSGKGGVDLTDSLTLRAVGRFIRTEGDFNDQDFNPTSPTLGFVIDSPDTRFENEAIYALAGAKLQTLGGSWLHDVSVQIADINRDTFGPFGRSAGSKGDRVKASYVSAYQINETHYFTFAADWEREGFRNTDPFGFASTERREIENVGFVGEYRFEGESFDASAAIRHDINDRFADATTFRAGVGYSVAEETRLRASIGSGIKNPGFFELFGFVDGSFIGNESLTPERSTAWEVGVDHGFWDGFGWVSLTYFNAVLEDEIFTTFPAPTFTATPANRDTVSKQQGIEVALSFGLHPEWYVQTAYTYLDAEEDGIEEVRRPKHIASASLNWESPNDFLDANLTVRYNGQAEDLAFTDPSFIPVRATLDDYVLVNLNARAKLVEGISAFGRVENLLDQTYEQVFSFVSPGRSAVVGIEARF